jgi:hypothetical protein
MFSILEREGMDESTAVLRHARIIGQPKLKKAAQTAEIAVDACHFFNPLVVQDAGHRVSQTHPSQIDGDEETGGSCHSLYAGLFVRQHRNAQSLFVCRPLLFSHDRPPCGKGR